MPDLTGQAASFRGGRFRFSGYISTIPQTVVFSRAVNMASISYPLKSITFDDPYSGVGSTSDVLADMTILVYSGNTTTLKGMLRVASGGAAGSTIQVSEFARGVVDLADNDRFDVVRDWRIFDKLVEASASLRKDSRITYTDQGSNPNPVCNSGGPGVGFISGASLSLNFYGSTSFTVDPDSAGSGTHAWSFGDGTPSSSTDADPVGVTFPAGFRWISHTFTDSTNSKSTTQRIPVWAHERTGANAPLSVQMENRAYNSGFWTARFRLPKEQQSDLSTLPDGALIVYWEEEQYDTSQASYGLNVANRSHVKFVGYLLRDTITFDADRNEVVFEAAAPLGILEQTPALPQLILSKASPANWQQVKSLTVNRILWYLLYWHTSLNTMHDFLWVSGSDLAYARIAIDNIDSIAGQLRDVATSINVQLTCDRLGRLLLIRDPNYLSSSDRNSRTTVYNLTTADIRNGDITREHRGQYKFVRGEGITASSSTASMKPVFANAPGNAPAWMGVGTEALSKQIVATQAELNNRAGWHFARINGLNDGQFVPKGARLAFRGAYDWLEPAYLEWLTLTLATTISKRGVAYTTNTRWVAESMDVNYDPEAGLKDVSVVVSHETDGPAATTYVPPASNGVGSFTPPEFNFDFGDFGAVLPWTGGLRPGLQTVAKFHAGNLYEISTDFETPSASGGPAWGVIVDLTALGSWPGGDLIGFEVDAYSPKYLGTGTAVNGWLTTDTHVMRITDIFGTPALTGIHAFGFTTPLRVMRFERGVQNWGIVASYLSGQGTYATYTTDGTTWTDVAVDTNNDTFPFGWQPGIWVSPHTAGLAYTSAFVGTGTGAGMVATLRRTLDYGATWATLATPATTPGRGLPHAIVVAFASGASPIFYPNTTDPAPFDPRLYRNNTDISPTISAAPYGPAQRVRSMSIADDNANVMMVCGADNFQGAATDYAVFLTQNAQAAVPTYTTLFSENTATPTYLQVYAASQSAFYLMGMAGSIAFSDGVTIDSRLGNSVENTEVIGICGG
jgi:hypothetical protein